MKKLALALLFLTQVFGASAQEYQLRILQKGLQAQPVVETANAWRSATLPATGYWRDIPYGNGRFLATYGSIEESTVILSTDGVTWSRSNLPVAASWVPVFGDNKFVAVGWGSGSRYSATSTDGVTWVSGSTPLAGIASTVRSLAYGNGIYITPASQSSTATQGYVSRSTDGSNWTTYTLPILIQSSIVAFGGGKFVVVPSGGPRYTNSLASSDGINWSTGTFPLSTTFISMTYGAGKFVGVSQADKVALISSDGISWTQHPLPANSSAGAIIYGNGKFVLGSTNGRSYQSTDGINWKENTMPSASVWYAMGYGNGRFVALGNNSTQGAYSD